MVQMNFDPNAHDPKFGAAGTLPVMAKPGGLVRVDSAEFKPNREGTGQYLQLNLTVIEQGQWQGMTGALRLNMQNPSAEAMQIAASQLSAICHVAGIQHVPTEQALVGAQFRLATQLQPGDNPKGYTEPTGVFDMAGNEPTRGQYAQATAQPAAQAPAAPMQQAAPAAPVAQQPAAAPVQQAAQPQAAPVVQQPAPAQPAQPAAPAQGGAPQPPSWAT